MPRSSPFPVGPTHAVTSALTTPTIPSSSIFDADTVQLLPSSNQEGIVVTEVDPVFPSATVTTTPPDAVWVFIDENPSGGVFKGSRSISVGSQGTVSHAPSNFAPGGVFRST